MKAKSLKMVGQFMNVLSRISPILSGAIILRKFSSPLLKKGFGEKRKAFLQNSSMSHFHIDNYKIAYYRWKGQGPAILLLHGWESNAARWRPLISRLQEKKFDIYAIDAPAHGFSSGNSVTPIEYASAIDIMVKRFNIEQLVGHSFGGFTALYYVAEYQNSINKIVGLAPTNSVSDVVDGMQEMMGFNERTIRAFNMAFKKKYGQIPAHFKASGLVKSIKTKGLLAHDENDQVLPYAGTVEIHKNWIDSKMITTNSLDHRLISSNIDAQIVDFLTSN